MKIHSLFILKTTGLCLYSRNFTEEFENLDVNLITPFFSAIFSFSNNVISRKLEELEMSGLRFVFVVKEDFIFTILADTSASLLFINTRLQRITDIFFRIYEQLDRFKEYKEIENEKFDTLIDSIIAGKEEIFTNRAFANKSIALFRKLIFENEIIGAALLSTTGNIIYSSLPNEVLLGSMKELEIRFMTKALDLPELFYGLPDNKKVFSKIITVNKRLGFLIVLLFESSVSLGMAEITLIRTAKQISTLLKKK